MDGTNRFRPIYLDHNATTPVDPGVLEAMLPYFTEAFGNPSSVDHAYGHEAAGAVEHARAEVARAIGARAEEVVFTGSCTEANNLAIVGLARALGEPGHFVTTAVEHPSVLEAFRAIEREGHSVTYIGVDREGRVDPDEVAAAITDRTRLVSVMAANNEVGALQPLREIGAVCERFGVLFHSDLAQAAAYVSVNVGEVGLHLASISAHKAYGPKGVGALYVRSRRPRPRLVALVHGGGQERGLRSGTVSTPLVVGMGAALEVARGRRERDAARLQEMTERLASRLSGSLEGVWRNGPGEARLPHTLSFSIEGVEPLALMRALRDVVSFSASSACSTREVRTSHVLLAMFGEGWRARQAFRLAPGRFTTDEEVERAAEALAAAAARLRDAVGSGTGAGAGPLRAGIG
jgi:cysteine desulfurase